MLDIIHIDHLDRVRQLKRDLVARFYREWSQLEDREEMLLNPPQRQSGVVPRIVDRRAK